LIDALATQKHFKQISVSREECWNLHGVSSTFPKLHEIWFTESLK